MPTPLPPGIKLVVGLGNPGLEYDHTYHNAGQLALEWLAGEASWKNRPTFEYARMKGMILVRPKTFMNDSGNAVTAALSYFKIQPVDLLVIHDESDLPLGTAKLVFGRGAAGHRGVSSIIAALGTKDFWRLRLGIRIRRGKAGGFVLKKMTAPEREILYGALGASIEKVTKKLTPS
ncbi:MAG TPA: aminoacyl-tRNA hydrolase [Candidatus Paceibacterota bacterium]|nr:aminoacyl-tRNA hydrolase [Candidatus Paceibacterota bacterium]